MRLLITNYLLVRSACCRDVASAFLFLVIVVADFLNIAFVIIVKHGHHVYTVLV